MKKIVIKIILSICIIGLICATIFSLVKFDVWNPFSACFGMIKVIGKDTQYTIVQNFPYRVILSGPNFQIDEYMKEQGYEKSQREAEEPGEVIYTNGEKDFLIEYRMNGYYGKYKIKELWNAGIKIGDIIQYGGLAIFGKDTDMTHTMVVTGYDYNNRTYLLSYHSTCRLNKKATDVFSEMEINMFRIYYM